MPQMDKEIFIEYFFCTFLILLQLFANESVSENFLKINVFFFLFNYFKMIKNILNFEVSLIKNIKIFN
jgi:hypothetical protein